MSFQTYHPKNHLLRYLSLLTQPLAAISILAHSTTCCDIYPCSLNHLLRYSILANSTTCCDIYPCSLNHLLRYLSLLTQPLAAISILAPQPLAAISILAPQPLAAISILTHSTTCCDIYPCSLNHLLRYLSLLTHWLVNRFTASPIMGCKLGSTGIYL